MPVLSPLDPNEWDPSLAEVRRQLGFPLNVHRVLANHPAWLRGWFGFRNHVVHGSTLSPRQFELIVLRVASLMDATYEWEHHVVTGKEAGLSDTEIERVRVGSEAPEWNRADRLLLRAVEECAGDRRIAPETLVALAAEFTSQQILDLVGTFAMYATLALVLRSFEVPMDDETPSFSRETLDR